MAMAAMYCSHDALSRYFSFGCWQVSVVDGQLFSLRPETQVCGADNSVKVPRAHIRSTLGFPIGMIMMVGAK